MGVVTHCHMHGMKNIPTTEYEGGGGVWGKQKPTIQPDPNHPNVPNHPNQKPKKKNKKKNGGTTNKWKGEPKGVTSTTGNTHNTRG